MKSATGFLSETETELVMATSIFNKRLKLRSADDYYYYYFFLFFFNDSWKMCCAEHTEVEQERLSRVC